MRRTILFLADIWPWPTESGGAQRAFHLIDQLHREFDVIVLGVTSGPGLEMPDRTPGVEVIAVEEAAVRGFSITDWWAPVPGRVRRLATSRLPFVANGWSGPVLDARLAELRAGGRIDAVWACRVWTAEAARRTGFARIVVDVDDVPSEVLTRMMELDGRYRTRWLHAMEVAKLRHYEARLSARFAAVAVCKRADSARVGAPNGLVFVVPNGVPDLPAVIYGREDPNALLFVGNLGYPPNADAVRFFCRDILPSIRRKRPDAVLLVAGKGAPTDLAKLPGCRLLGFVPDISPLFDRAVLAVAPLRMGGGTKLKVLDSVARGRATVCTPTALEGIDLTPGEEVLLASDAEGFAQCCLLSMADAVSRERIGRAGRGRVFDEYRWAHVGATARSAVHQLCEAGNIP